MMCTDKLFIKNTAIFPLKKIRTVNFDGDFKWFHGAFKIRAGTND